MDTITIEHRVTPAKLEVLYVDDWPIWEKEISTFEWTYTAKETCYIVEGEAVITPHNGTAVTITEGDLVIFPQGMSCTWDIKSPIEKHYKTD